MKKEKIALQLYSVRGDLEKDFYGTIRAVKEIGYAGVEFAGLYGQDPEKVKAFCEELGIVPLSAHVPFQAFMADMDGTIAQYKALGVQYVAIPYLTEDLRPGQPGFQTVIDGMKVIGEALNAAGIVQQYHNHDPNQTAHNFTRFILSSIIYIKIFKYAFLLIRPYISVTHLCHRNKSQYGEKQCIREQGSV